MCARRGGGEEEKEEKEEDSEIGCRIIVGADVEIVRWPRSSGWMERWARSVVRLGSIAGSVEEKRLSGVA
jgi:hypothetical protein